MKYFVFIFFFIFGAAFLGYSNPVTNNTETNDNYRPLEIQIMLAIADQDDAIAYLLESPTPTHNWLFVYADKWGITESVKNDAYSLWKDLKNVNILIVDLNDGIVPADNQEAMALLLTNDVDRDHAIIQSAIEFTGENAKIGSLGWCYGGSWSIQSAIQSKGKEVACVIYYGMPETNISKLKTLNSDVLAIYGSMDTYITPTIAHSFKNTMHKAGKNVIELTYEGKGQFANRASSLYNHDHATNAYSKVLDYLKSKFE